MKLILLRHEKREDYPGFYSNLTKDGFKDSIKLINKLNKININYIYCSPLVRTLQTIHPYCIKNKKKVFIEYALHEYKHNPYFLIEPQIYDIKDINNNFLTKISDKKYKSKFKKTDFDYLVLETESHLEKRLTKFLDTIKKNKKLENETILLVTHKGVINKIKKMYNLCNDMDCEFEKGHFEIITI